MKKFIDSIIRLLITIVIIVALVAICIILYIIFTSKINNTTVENTVSYFKSFANQYISFSSNNIKEPINITSDYSNNANNNDNDNNNLKSTKSYYYEQLDDNAKIIYTAFEDNIDNLKKDNYKINFSTKFNTLLNKSDGQYKLNKAFQSALDVFFYDHPELFYIDITKISLLISYSSFGSKTTYNVSIIPQNGDNYLLDDFSSEDKVNLAVQQVEKARDNIINNISSKSDYNKALEVHDILVSSLEYDSTFSKPNIHNIYGALTQNYVVCEGYAKAFKYILDSLGIECILVNGTATNSSGESESHMWNYIKLDDKWYGVDVTWDDPIIIGGYTKNIIRHDYFCKGSSTFNIAHDVSNKLSDKGMFFNLPTLSNQNYK